MNVMAGSLLGPFLTGLAHYYSLRYIEASRSTIFQSARGLLVVIGAIVYLGINPLPNEITGGLLTIAGVALLTLGKRISRSIARYLSPAREG
jgi:drug/metabolite transporter (DMT)-like permease